MSQNYLASRSSNLSSFNAIAMNYSTLTVSTLSGVSTLNVSRVITTSTIQVNSSMISLGNSTNQVYVSSLSYGNFSTSSTWATSLTNRLSTATVLMSANAQYQMTVSPSTTVSSIMYTSTLGQSWTTISAATGLPSATATSYTAGAISGDGQYAALGAYGGYLYRTANSGATWTNTNPNTPAIYLPLNGSVTDIIGTSNPSVQGTNAGSISYVTGIVGTRAINLINTPVGTATQYVRGTWVAVSNFSVSLWCNPQSASASMIIFAIGNALQIQTNGISGLQLQAPGISSSVSYPVATNTWYNITVIFQANSTCYFYVNNVLIASPTSTGSVPSGSYSLGTYDTGTSNAFNGYIDDFKIYNSAITFTPMVPQNWSSTAISNTGQYILATATGAGLYMSSNFGATWTQVTGAMLNAIWSAAQVSATGQYLIAYSTPVMVQPQLTGLTGNITTTSPVYTSWQTNGITWTSFCSSIVDNNANFQAWVAFNNLGNSSSAPYSWASARNYDATTGAYTGSLSTTIQSVAAQTGEWIQIQSSVPITLYSYNFACGTFAAIPKTYFIIGSNDGSTWYPIQSGSIGTNPFTVDYTVATSAQIIVNQSGSQTMTAGTSGTLTCTTYTTNTTAAYTYFRLIGTSTFGPTLVRCCEFTELYLNFQAGGQTYSTNYGSTWNNGYAVQTPTALSLSESGQYAIGANNSSVYITSNFLQGFSTGIPAIPPTSFQTPLNAVTNVPVASAVSNTGQYMVIITNNVSGNNVYYSTNFGAYFAGLILGTTLLTSCAISYDGSYITVSNATTTWTLNNNSNGFSLALGNQAGYQNQGQNAIAIGNGAGSINQTANSIILNASPAAVNAFAPGFYVAPIAFYTASSSQTFSLLGYGTDNQVVQTGITTLYGTNGYIGIGTANPRTHLDLNGTMIVNTTSTNAMLRFTNDSGINYIQSGSILADGSSAPLYFTSIYGQNKWMTIAANGNVGIGTTNPTALLHVNGMITAPTLNGGIVSITGSGTNVLIGSNSLVSAGGANNMSIGINNGRTAGTGSNNILVGMLVGSAMTSASENMIFGVNAGNLMTTGFDNCIFGLNSGNTLNTGHSNTCMGRGSGLRINSGAANTIIGKNAGDFLTTGDYNVAVGERALTNLATAANTGSFNSALGHYTLRDTTSGSYNTGLGGYAGGVLTTGIYNTYIGWNATASSGGVDNEIAIGVSQVGRGPNSAVIKTGNNGFYLSGYTAVGTLGIVGAGQVQNGSDRDMKNNITYLSNQGAIQKVLGLKPCTYELKLDKNPNPKVYTGFIAQDVDEVIPTAVDGRKYKYQYEQNADGSPKVDEEGNVVYMKDENGNKLRRYLGLNITDILATSVLAIQEQNAIITAQQTQIDTLIQRLAAANIA